MKANLPQREPAILTRWNEIDLYARLMEARAQAVPWVLHDGPPYANGAVHIGTALNKVLKDFIVRSRSMMGYRTPFVPGWDCHGMPIEHQVTRALGERARTIPKLALRKLCREHAEKWIDIQRADFRRLGVIGDWDHPYLTFAPEYDAAEVGVLRRMVELRLVYRGLRPVHWCIECRTALAEAEVDYRDHVSPSIYVAFKLNANLGDAAALAREARDGAELAAAHKAGRLFAVIWTTTPWTLPANLGITLNPAFDYVALKSTGAYYIVAARLADSAAGDCALEVTGRIALSAAALSALDGKDIFRHPFIERDVKLMFGGHVTADTGTGLVHTAPGHGYEDFVIGQKYGLPALTPVDDAGVFTAEGGAFAGRGVFEANDAIVAELKRSGALLHGGSLTHSYPHCWRCGQALIFRATEQWFLGVDRNGLRAQALASIDAVRWVPQWARDRIRNMVETRPDWCLSRQRAWGVPIPALRCVKCGEVALAPEVMRRTEEIFAREGSDAWYARPLKDFAGGYRCKCGGADFTREEDVLDVWFDSGCSQAAVLERRPELTWPADAYVEGVDQARGWFQSSLLCAAATRERAPYKTVVSHGLTQDDLGRKMSKSLGNTEDVAEVVKRIGADLLRMVYASVDYSADMNIGKGLFAAVAEQYRKLRNTARFVLGNLGGFDPARDAPAPAAMAEFDRYILTRLERLKAAVRAAYERFDFQAAYHAIVNFVVIDLSALYVDVARDRLYCDAPASPTRRSAQTALFKMLDELLRMLAPLIPFTAEEIYSYMPGARPQSVHLLELKAPDPAFADAGLEARWATMLKVRGEALKLLEAMRQARAIGAPLEAVIALAPAGGAEDGADGGAAAALLTARRAALKELFIVSEVVILDRAEAERLHALAAGRADFRDGVLFGRLSSDPPLLLVGRRAPGIKCARCWVYFDDGGDPELCPRCRAIVRAPA